MKMPKKIKVSYSDYEISEARKEFADQNLFDGLTDFEQQKIKYKADLKPNDVVNTIIHEILHCINFHFGMKHTQAQSSKMEEQFVDCAANGLTTVFRDNPELLTWIKATLTK